MMENEILEINVEEESKNFTEILSPAIINTKLLEDTEHKIFEYVRTKYEKLLPSNACYEIHAGIDEVLDSAIKAREQIKKENDFNARIALRTYNAQMSEPEKGLGFSIITNDFLSAASYLALSYLDTEKQMLKKTELATRTLSENLKLIQSPSSMYEGDVIDLFRAVSESLKRTQLFFKIKKFLQDHPDFYTDKSKYDSNEVISDYNVYDLLAESITEYDFIGVKPHLRETYETLCMLQAKGYVKILTTPEHNGHIFYSTTLFYEETALKRIHYAAHPEEAATAENEKNGLAQKLYAEAEEQYKKGKYYEAAVLYAKADSIPGAIEKSIEIWNRYILGTAFITTGISQVDAIKYDGTVYHIGKSGHIDVDTDVMLNKIASWNNMVQVISGSLPVGLSADGTVRYLAPDIYKTSSFPYISGNGTKLKDIIHIEYSGSHLVCIHADGRVSSYGGNEKGECNTESWSSVMKVAVTYKSTVGIRADGTICVAGLSDVPKEKYASWRNITDVSVCGDQLIGLTSNGTAFTAVPDDGKHDYAKDVSEWTDLVTVFAFYDGFIGITKKGNVLYTGRNKVDKVYFENQEKVAYLYNFGSFILHADGTLSVRDVDYDVSDWNNIVYAIGKREYICGVHSDGTVSFRGKNRYIPDFSKISDWRLFDDINSVKLHENERVARKRNERIDRLQAELESTKAELQNVKGLFAAKKRERLENRIREIERQLKD